MGSLHTDADRSRVARPSRIADIDVAVASGEIYTGIKAQGDVAAARCVVKERTKTDCRVVVACLDVGAKERKVSLSRVVVGIASVRRRSYGPTSGRKPEADERKGDETWQNCRFELNHWIHGSSFLFFFSAALILAVAGLEEAKNPAGNVLRPIQIRLATLSMRKISPNCQEPRQGVLTT